MRFGTLAVTEKSSEGNKMLKRLEKMEFKGTEIDMMFIRLDHSPPVASGMSRGRQDDNICDKQLRGLTHTNLMIYLWISNILENICQLYNQKLGLCSPY